MLASDVAWGIAPCSYCDDPGEALLDGELVCIRHAVELIERAEAVAQFGDTARQVLPALMPRELHARVELLRPLSPELEREDLRTLRKRFWDGEWFPSYPGGEDT